MKLEAATTTELGGTERPFALSGRSSFCQQITKCYLQCRKPKIFTARTKYALISEAFFRTVRRVHGTQNLGPITG